MIGAFVAIAIAKMTFGGLGKNPFNPALVGRVFLLIAYPAQMTSFPYRPVPWPMRHWCDAAGGRSRQAVSASGARRAGTASLVDMPARWARWLHWR